MCRHYNIIVALIERSERLMEAGVKEVSVNAKGTLLLERTKVTEKKRKPLVISVISGAFLK